MVIKMPRNRYATSTMGAHVKRLAFRISFFVVTQERIINPTMTISRMNLRYGFPFMAGKYCSFMKATLKTIPRSQRKFTAPERRMGSRCCESRARSSALSRLRIMVSMMKYTMRSARLMASHSGIMCKNHPKLAPRR